jgi:hypothetical protein
LTAGEAQLVAALAEILGDSPEGLRRRILAVLSGETPSRSDYAAPRREERERRSVLENFKSLIASQYRDSAKAAQEFHSMTQQLANVTNERDRVINETHQLLVEPLAHETARELRGLREAASRRWSPMCDVHEMPVVPADGLPITNNRALPQESGVYFVWVGEVVVYVGESVNLSQRVVLSHPKVNAMAGEWASWVRCPYSDNFWWESFYIWLCRPERNLPSRFDRQIPNR